MLFAVFAVLMNTEKSVREGANAAFLEAALPSTRAPKDNSPGRATLQHRDR
jgi:hypothetical protein